MYKRFFAVITAFALIITAAYFTVTADVLPAMQITGSISELEDGRFLVESYFDDTSVILNITDDTYIVDASTGEAIPLGDRTGDRVIAYYGPVMTRSMPPISNAVVILCNLGEIMLPPIYGSVEEIERVGDEAVYVTINGGSAIVLISREAPISAYSPGAEVSIDDITIGTGLILYCPIMGMSYPAQGSSDKTVILGTAAPVIDTPVSDESMPDMPEFELGDFQTQYYNETIESTRYISQITREETFMGANYAVTVHTTVAEKNNPDRVLKMTDIIKGDVYGLVTSVINNRINNSKDIYFFTGADGFNGVDDNTSFYINEQGNLVIVFDKGEIAASTAGVIEFVIPLPGRR